MFDNGLISFTFGRDDDAGGVVTGWTNTSITATSVVVDGTELAHNLNGVDPRDPDREHSLYVDAGGGRSRLVCTEVRVLRNTTELAVAGSRSFTWSEAVHGTGHSVSSPLTPRGCL